MRYQKIESQIWFDEKFMQLTPMEQRLFFYLLTCPHANIIGLYVLRPGYACADLKSLPKDFEKDLAKVCKVMPVQYDQNTDLILIENFQKHNPITNPNQKTAAIKILSQLPKSPLLLRFKVLNEGLCKGLTKVLPEGLPEVLLKPDTETDTETDTDTDTRSKRIPSRRTSLYGCPFFKRFWEIYPRKEGKKRAWDEWVRIDDVMGEPLFSSMEKTIDLQKRSEGWTKDNGQFIPHPATWLRQRRWEDEPMKKVPLIRPQPGIASWLERTEGKEN